MDAITRFGRGCLRGCAVAALAALVLLVGCQAAARPEGEVAMRLTSDAFIDGTTMPQALVRRAAGGRNESPPLEWSGAPDDTRSFAIAVVDRAPVARDWVHWLVVGISPDVSGVSAGASGTRGMPRSARELRNGFGEVGYGGPEPPAGTGQHPYEFTIYALDIASPQVGPAASLAEFYAAIDGHVLASSTLTGTYGR